MQDPTGKPRTPGSSLSLLNLLQSLGVDIQCALNNSGNDAFLGLLGLQLLLDPEHTKIPSTRGKNPLPQAHMMGMMGRGAPMAMPPLAYVPPMPLMSPYGMMPLVSPPLISPPGSAPPNGHRYSSSGESLGIRKTASQTQLVASSTNHETRPRRVSALAGGGVTGSSSSSSGDGKGSSGPNSGTISEDEVVAKLGGMRVTSV